MNAIPLQPFSITQFGGLNLADDPQEIGLAGAVDLLNVDLDRRGRLRTRDGYVTFGDALSTATQFLIPSLTPGANEMIAMYQNGSNMDLVVFSSDGTDASPGGISNTAGVVVTGSYASMGSVAGETIFTRWSSSANALPIRHAGGTAFVTTSSMGSPAFVAVTPASNRLVSANFHTSTSTPSGADGTRSTVFFSDPDDPVTYGSSNWVQLRPNDGEDIVGTVTWGDNVYIFKQSRCFVFLREGVDPSTSLPAFDWFEVPLPAPLSTATGQTRPYVVAGTDGVYYSTVSGIYRIVRDRVALVSGAISEIFGVDSEYSTLRFDGNPPVLSWASGRLFATYTTTGSATRTLVYDPAGEYWLVWSNVGSTGAYATFPPFAYNGSPATGDFQERILFPVSTQLYYMDRNADDDNGSSISWSYTSGTYDLDMPGQEKIIRYSSLHGSGTATLQVAVDHGSVDTGSAVALGTAPAIDEGFQDIDRAGLLFAHKLSGTGPAVVNRVTHYVSHARSVGLRSA